MSGHKRTTITLSQEEYRKLHEAEMRLRFMNEGIPEIINQTRKEINEQMQTDLADLQFRHEALIESLGQVNQDISSIEQNTSQALLDQHLALQQGLADVVGNYHVETESALASMENQVQSQLEELINQHNHDWAWMANEWHHQANGHMQKMQLANEWLQAASVLEQFILENYDHNRFTPGEVRRYESRLIQAQNNLTQNLPESAITAAQEVYNNFSELRLELEKRQTEYKFLLNRVHLEAQSLVALFKSNQVVPAIDLEGNPLPYNITVDYWTVGELEHLTQEFYGVLNEMVDTLQPAPSNELNELITHYFPCIEDKVADIVFTARMKVINAQLRMNIAEIVVQALSGQGYALDASYFLSGDERDAYQANLINYEGSQVVVKVDPVENREAINELHLFTSDAQEKTSHELKQRALEIRRALQSSGLEVGTITATRKTPDPAIFEHPLPNKQVQITKHRDIQRVKKQGRADTGR